MIWRASEEGDSSSRTIRASLKKAKKAEKKELEAKAIQQQYDLRPGIWRRRGC